MELADLARWTPIGFDFSGRVPVVDWADLTAERFVDPFSTRRLPAGCRARMPGHSSGPGSRRSLLSTASRRSSRRAWSFTSHVADLRSCPASCEQFPASSSSRNRHRSTRSSGSIDLIDEAALVRLVRLLARALGRRRHGDERHLVLKCTSWNIRRREILAAAFPERPWIWLQRGPVRVLASLCAEPPGWLGLQGRPYRAARLFGLDPAAVPAMSGLEFAARVLGAMLDAAAADPGGRLLIDYADLPAAIWQRVIPHFGLEADAAAIERMIEESRYYSKDPESRIFTGDAAERRPAADAMRDAAERFAEPGYRALASYA